MHEPHASRPARPDSVVVDWVDDRGSVVRLLSSPWHSRARNRQDAEHGERDADELHATEAFAEHHVR